MLPPAHRPASVRGDTRRLASRDPRRLGRTRSGADGSVRARVIIRSCPGWWCSGRAASSRPPSGTPPTPLRSPQMPPPSMPERRLYSRLSEMPCRRATTATLPAFVFYLFQQRSLLRRAPPPAARDQLWLLTHPGGQFEFVRAGSRSRVMMYPEPAGRVWSARCSRSPP